jgi:hypothetical protein
MKASPTRIEYRTAVAALFLGKACTARKEKCMDAFSTIKNKMELTVMLSLPPLAPRLSIRLSIHLCPTPASARPNMPLLHGDSHCLHVTSLPFTDVCLTERNRFL